MSETRIEYLLRAIAPRTDRATSALAPPRERRDAFDNHLRDVGAASSSDARTVGLDTSESPSRNRSIDRDRDFGDDANDPNSSRADNQEPPTSSRTSSKSTADKRDFDDDDRNSNASFETRDGITVEQASQSSDPIVVNQQVVESGAPGPTNSEQGQSATIRRPPYGDKIDVAAAATSENPAGSIDSENHVDPASIAFANAEHIDGAPVVPQSDIVARDAESQSQPLATTEVTTQNLGAAAAAISQSERTGSTAESASEAKVEVASRQAADSAVANEEKSDSTGGHNDAHDEGSAEPTQQPAETIDRHSPAQEGKRVTPDVSSLAAPTAAEGAASNLSKSPEDTVNGRVVSNDDRVDGLLTSLNRLQRNGGLSRRAQSGEGQDGSRVDATRFVDRVSKAFQSTHERGGTLTLRLSPAELGSLRLELTVLDGAMTASVETESNMTRKVLLEHLPALRERLAEQNIRIERFDVDVRRDGGGSQPNTGFPGENRGEGPAPRQRARMQSTSNPDHAVGTAATPAQIISNAELNLIV